MVGSVVVKNGRVIGEGYHENFGGPHAEVNALKGLSRRQTAGATLYATLEPCAHQGKTPPCAELIVDMKVTRVVVAMKDPNPLVNGKGIAFLRSKGIGVETGLMEEAARELNEPFIKYITTNRPFVVLKSAMTLDGKIATVTNASRWITGERSRRRVHFLRHSFSAVMVGINTVMYDDPLLNVRLNGKRRNPLKIIIDTRAKISPESKLLANDPQLAIIATTALADPGRIRLLERTGCQALVCPVKEGLVDLTFLMQALGTMGIDSVLLEGGSTLAFSALREGIVDKLVVFIAPKIIGGENAPTPVGGAGIKTMEEALNLKHMRSKRSGDDIMIEAWL